MLLDFILDHAGKDERPYLRVSIFDRTFHGLLDSGASRTILGQLGWKMLNGICPLTTTQKIVCTVADGGQCASIGTITVPITVRNRTKVFDLLVIPSLPQALILGTDFWRGMAIIPDLRHGEWTFASDPNEVDVCALQTSTHLTHSQQADLDKLMSDAFATMKTGIGCTQLVEHQIKTDSMPIKQRYYPISPALQKHVDQELDSIL